MNLREMLLTRALAGGSGGGGGGGDSDNFDWVIGDGDTHIWVTLPEGRTSPMVGVGVNGTVTVDWGDGSAPDTLTGTSTSTVKYTPNHDYKSAGDYVITISGGEFLWYGGILFRTTSGGTSTYTYTGSIRKIELGAGAKNFGSLGSKAVNLEKVYISDGVTQISNEALKNCNSLTSVYIPDSVTNIGSNAIAQSGALKDVRISNCVTSIPDYMFYNCYPLTGIHIPDSVASIGRDAFVNCNCLASVHIPKSVQSIGMEAFYNCYSVAYYDFSQHTTVPTLSNTNAFTGIASDCQIRVPAALVDSWKAATNWSTYASKIVGV